MEYRVKSWPMPTLVVSDIFNSQNVYSVRPKDDDDDDDDNNNNNNKEDDEKIIPVFLWMCMWECGGMTQANLSFGISRKWADSKSLRPIYTQG
jgi:hypothetical protein